VPRCIPLVPQL
jgi:hypothetical protein